MILIFCSPMMFIMSDSFEARSDIQAVWGTTRLTSGSAGVVRMQSGCPQCGLASGPAGIPGDAALTARMQYITRVTSGSAGVGPHTSFADTDFLSQGLNAARLHQHAEEVNVLKCKFVNEAYISTELGIKIA